MSCYLRDSTIVQTHFNRHRLRSSAIIKTQYLHGYPVPKTVQRLHAEMSSRLIATGLGLRHRQR